MKRLYALAMLTLLCAAPPAFAASSYTQCLRGENPVPGDPTVRNAWGTIENTGRSLLDTSIAGTISLSVAGNSNVTLTAADGGADQARNAHYIFTGALTGNINVFWPVYCRAFSVFNNTSGAFTLTVAVVGTPGTTIAIPQGASMYLVSDGTNISQRLGGAIGGAGGGVLTLPAGPDTLVARTSTDTLTNKTLTAPIIATISNTGTLTLPTVTDTILGRLSTDTLTNKSISGATNTLTAIANASLTNNSITIGGTSTALGGTVTASTILDSIGNTRGNVLFRGAAIWTALAVGTAGQFLRSGGAGADVTWVTGLLAANNLSDVANAGTSRTNLGLGTIATHNYAIATVGAGCHTGGASGDVCYEY